MSDGLKGSDRNDWEMGLLTMPIKPGPKLVLHALLRYAGGKSECWPSNASLMKVTGFNEKTLATHLTTLEKALRVVDRVEDMSLVVQRRFVFPSHPGIGAGEVKSSPPAMPTRGENHPPGGVKSSPPGGVKSSGGGGVKSSPQIFIEPEEEKSVSQSDGPTDVFPSGGEKKSGCGGLSSEGSEMIRKVLAGLPTLPSYFRESAESARFQAEAGSDWKPLALALVKIKRLGARAKDRPTRYLAVTLADVKANGVDPEVERDLERIINPPQAVVIQPATIWTLTNYATVKQATIDRFAWYVNAYHPDVAEKYVREEAARTQEDYERANDCGSAMDWRTRREGIEEGIRVARKIREAKKAGTVAG